jgi:hypothetical protein
MNELEQQALANLKAYSVFGNAYSVTQNSLDPRHFTGWIAGSLFESFDYGKTWQAVGALWRTG